MIIILLYCRDEATAMLTHNHSENSAQCKVVVNIELQICRCLLVIEQYEDKALMTRA